MIVILVIALFCFEEIAAGDPSSHYDEGGFNPHEPTVFLDERKEIYYDEPKYPEQDHYAGDKYRLNSDRGSVYDRDCYEYVKDHAEYERCQNYYKKCRGSETSNKNDNCVYSGNIVGLGPNDREDKLIRPCAFEDRQCIRKFFAENSNCKPAYGPIPDPLHMKRLTAYLPFANISAVLTRPRITGLASLQVTELYVNEDTKNLVIAFSFRKLNISSPSNNFRYHRRAKESIVLADFSSVEYSSGTFTAVIPSIPHLRLDLAEVHVFLDAIPSLILGPGISDSLDPAVLASITSVVANLAVASEEFFLFQAQLFVAVYIQETICNFGLNLISI